MTLRKEPGKLVLAIVSFFFLFHLILAAKAGLVADEAYYWIWSLHPQMSYFDHPPAIAWTIAFFTHIFGTTPLGVRMAALLISAGISFFLFKMGKEFLKDRWAGAWAVIFISSSLLFSAGAFIITPDSLVIFFFVLTLWQFYHAMETGSGRAMLLAGLWFGLGLLSKYTMVLLGPLLLVYLLASRRRRAWLARPSLWGSALLAVLLFTPVILWNREHNWASFRFQWHHGMEAHQYSAVAGFFDYLGGQIGVMTPIVYLILIAAAIWGIRESRRNPDGPVFYFWITSYPILLFFAYSSLKAKVEANWPVDGYIGAFLVAGAMVSSFSFRPVLLKTAMAGSLLGILATLAVGLQIFWPVIPLDPNVDPTGRMAGFGTEDRMIRKIVNTLPPDRRPLVWVVEGYPNTSLLKFIEYRKIPVYQIRPKRPFRTTVLPESVANQLVGHPVLLIQNGPHGGFSRDLGGVLGETVYLGTVLVPRRGASDQSPIIESDIYLIPSFKNGLSNVPPPFLKIF